MRKYLNATSAAIINYFIAPRAGSYKLDTVPRVKAAVNTKRPPSNGTIRAKAALARKRRANRAIPDSGPVQTRQILRRDKRQMFKELRRTRKDFAMRSSIAGGAAAVR